MIQAGLLNEIDRESGDWLFIDIGFSAKSKTCGVLLGGGRPRTVTFAELRSEVLGIATASVSPLNLLIEAPLSVAFTADGNPTGRSLEQYGSRARYWYVGLGCGVLLATTYLLRDLFEHRGVRPIRLFEGFVSFKEKGVKSGHDEDVLALRSVVWSHSRPPASVCAAEKLKRQPTDRVVSAFRVAGMDFGVPPVVIAMANNAVHPTGEGGILGAGG
jgi:hypothetical protein